MNNNTIARTLARGIRLSVVAALLALLTGLLAVTQPARAYTYVVTNTNNSGPGSLRQAITNANSKPIPHTITFDAATDGIPIVLAGAAGEDFNSSGDLDILDGGDLTIQGNGVTKTIIDGGGIDRVLHICPFSGCANTVTFTGVTIRNGIAAYGGGIHNSGTTTVTGSRILNNTANIYGGGIFNAGTTTVDGSDISANTSNIDGGGIFNMGECTLNVQNGSTIGGTGVGNTAENGGGILNWNGTTTVDDSTVSANTASNDGGGIYNSDGTATVTGSSVLNNNARFGGGIYNYDGTLNVQNGSTIGGAGAGNTATSSGGGIYNSSSGTTTVDGSTVSANTATNGGGISNYNSTLNVQNGSTIGGAGAGNTATSSGGGIYNETGTTTVTGSRILNNTATSGSGVFNNRDFVGATSVTGSCIVGNSATSFFNNQPAQQIATGNWWGAATGPNTPGADTVGGGSVDTSGYLTEPILGCGFNVYHVYLPLALK